MSERGADRFFDDLRQWFETGDTRHLGVAAIHLCTDYKPSLHQSFLRGVIVSGERILLDRIPDSEGSYNPRLSPERIMRNWPGAEDLESLARKGMSTTGLACVVAGRLSRDRSLAGFFRGTLARTDVSLDQILTGNGALYAAPVNDLCSFITTQVTDFRDAFDEAAKHRRFYREHNLALCLGIFFGFGPRPEDLAELPAARRQRLGELMSAHGRLQVHQACPTLRHLLSGWKRRDPLFL